MSTPRKPLGKPLPDNDDDLARRAVVTPERLQEAAVWWRRLAPKKAKTLLDSEEGERGA